MTTKKRNQKELINENALQTLNNDFLISSEDLQRLAEARIINSYVHSRAKKNEAKRTLFVSMLNNLMKKNHTKLRTKAN